MENAEQMPPDGGERELVERCIRRDEAAWDELVEAYSPVVYRVVAYRLYRVTGARINYADVENIFQEIFAGLAAGSARRLREFGFRCSLAAWLTVIANRAALDYIRNEKTRGRVFEGGEDGAEEDALLQELAEKAHGEALAQEEMAWRIDEVKAAMSSLTLAEQMLVDGVYFKGLKYKEVARILEMPVNSVSPTLARALEKLRDRLANRD